MTETEWIKQFVRKMILLRGKKAEPKAIEDLARFLYPILGKFHPAEVAKREVARDADGIQ